MFITFNVFKALWGNDMKYNVRKITNDKCEIKLVPDGNIDKLLLSIKDENEKALKADTFEYHYQRAVTFKFGPKAHLLGITEINYPSEVIADYVLEGGSIGDF